VYSQVTDGKSPAIAATIGWRESRRLPSQGEGLAMEDHVRVLRASVGFLFLFRFLFFFLTSPPHNKPIAGKNGGISTNILKLSLGDFLRIYHYGKPSPPSILLFPTTTSPLNDEQQEEFCNADNLRAFLSGLAL
jgi:hypothetical protein